MAGDKQGPSLTRPAPPWLVKVAVGMLLFAAVITIVKILIDDEPAAITPVGSRPSVTSLTLPEANLLKCQVPNVEVLKVQTLAFEGVPTAIVGRTVTLEVTRWFRGEPTDLVTIEEASPEMRLALSGVEFELGERYLVSATDGQVTLCGFSAPYDKELADLFAQAYAA